MLCEFLSINWFVLCLYRHQFFMTLFQLRNQYLHSVLLFSLHLHWTLSLISLYPLFKLLLFFPLMLLLLQFLMKFTLIILFKSCSSFHSLDFFHFGLLFFFIFLPLSSSRHHHFILIVLFFPSLLDVFHKILSFFSFWVLDTIILRINTPSHLFHSILQSFFYVLLVNFLPKRGYLLSYISLFLFQHFIMISLFHLSELIFVPGNFLE